MDCKYAYIFIDVEILIAFVVCCLGACSARGVCIPVGVVWHLLQPCCCPGVLRTVLPVLAGFSVTLGASTCSSVFEPLVV